MEFAPEVVVSPRSSSPIAKAFEEDEALKLAWDNNVQFHVARNLLMLRRYRHQTQTMLAGRAGTSQAKIARIESGAENITLETLRRVIEALAGRFSVSIAPRELAAPSIPNWWQLVEVDGSEARWHFKGVRIYGNGAGRTAEATWTSVDNGWESGSLEPVLIGHGDDAEVMTAEFVLEGTRE